MDTERRAQIHAALGDPVRLAIVDELRDTDRSPGELADRLGTAPSLLAFHLETLERARLVERIVSSGDRRRRYVRLVTDELDRVLDHLLGHRSVVPGDVVFVCTHNSARSQLAAAVWRATRGPASSAGTEPSEAIAAGAVAAARRAGLDLTDAAPRALVPTDLDRHVITVCDRAHEQLPAVGRSWHWSVPDPVAVGTDAAFDRALAIVRSRIASLHEQEPP